MPSEAMFEVCATRKLTRDVVEMRLVGDTSAITAPGQFVDVLVDGCFLRRPLSVCDWNEGMLTLVFRMVGAGTEKLAACAPGARLNLLTGLGNGFPLPEAGARVLLAGGGVGVPPLVGLARRLTARGNAVAVALGFRGRTDACLMDRFPGCDVRVTTEDGTLGARGRVTDLLPGMRYDVFYACGPMPMLRALCACSDRPGFVSLEARMGCGFGACMGCTCHTLLGDKRICKDGPVFAKEALQW